VDNVNTPPRTNDIKQNAAVWSFVVDVVIIVISSFLHSGGSTDCSGKGCDKTCGKVCGNAIVKWLDALFNGLFSWIGFNSIGVCI